MGNNADTFFHDVISRWRLCRFCLHLHNLVAKLTCNAFPEGIPAEIASGRFIHNRPFPGQENDLTFDPCGTGPKESDRCQAGRAASSGFEYLGSGSNLSQKTG